MPLLMGTVTGRRQAADALPVIIEQVEPSVVRIEVSGPAKYGHGSSFVVEGGWVATKWHGLKLVDTIRWHNNNSGAKTRELGEPRP